MIEVADTRRPAVLPLERSNRWLEQITEGVYQTTADGRWVAANPALAKMLGYASVEELLTAALTPLYHNLGEREQFNAQMARDGHVCDLEQRLRKKNGEIVVVLENAWLVCDDRGEPLFYEGVLRDITEVRRLEHQFRQAQKMEAVGRLAGGVAHDFNNMLMAILGYVELLLDGSDVGTPHAHLREIKHAAERAARLTRQLLAFSRQQVLQPTILDLNVVVQQVETMLRPLIGENINLVTRLERDLPAIRADAAQLEQVIVNLVVNARDAMPHGGTLEIATAAMDLDPTAAARFCPMSPGRYVRLTVSDSGVGIDRATHARIFEPFFTTKAKGKGTGLGLSTVYGIVKQSGGFIWFDSAPGKGTTFSVYIPPVAAEAMVQTTSPPPVWTNVEKSSGGTILLMEDEAEVRRLLVTMLTSAGYHVTDAASAEEGLILARQARQPIDVLLTDIVMTGQNGVTAARQFSTLWPSAKVMFMSGYTDSQLMAEIETMPHAVFLLKPFTPNQLLDNLRTALSA